MRYGEEPPAPHSTCRPSSGSFCAGEVLNAPAWSWLQETVFKDRVPMIDHMWQTETGGPIFGNPYGIGPAADQARARPGCRCRASRSTW